MGVMRGSVSVIVPARNEETNLANCLDSLVGQSGPSYKIIVVDDHSSDSTCEIAKAYPVQVIPADPFPEAWSGKCNSLLERCQSREREVAALHRWRHQVQS